MRNLFKKSLTLCLVAILAFSCFAGIVSAETAYTATIAVVDQTITQGTTSVDVTLNITSSQIGINEALIEVSSDIGTINSKATLDEPTAAIASIELPEGSTNYGSFYLSAKNDISGETGETTVLGSIATASITVTFTVDENKAVGTYPINIKVDGVRAASGNEDVITFTYATANVTVAEPHVHKYTYTPNDNKTHNGVCACNEAPITNEACVDGDDQDTLCDKCGQELNEVVEPETFTVTFVDSDGTTVLKTEEVAPNGAATAPEVADDDANNTYFAGWDKEFSNITEDTTVTAKYTNIAFRVKTANLLLEGAIVLRMAIGTDVGSYTDENIEEFGILVWDANESTDYLYDAAHAVLPDEESLQTDGKYQFLFPKVAKQMNDAVITRAFVKLKNGKILYGKKNGVNQDPVSTSVSSYAHTRLNGTKATVEEKELYKAMLNYGASAQIAFKYNATDLPNADFTDDDKIIEDVALTKKSEHLPADGNETVTDIENSRIRTASLDLDSITYITYGIKLENEDTSKIKKVQILSWNQTDYNKALSSGGAIFNDNVTDVTDTTFDGTSYKGISCEILADELRDDIYARGYIEYTDGTFGYTRLFKYSVEAYCKTGIESTAAKHTAEMKVLYKAIMVYANKSIAYFS